ncbi:DNA adenine methylase [Listeria sp. ILCC792]|uniref:DNA adenine methylase n=1 Tax=Listeria sp. ILCC792 TaxID=1918331 RepID=UPI000B59079D|nr:DNA adenine methylase [Listeria sp. ILCC792]
MGKPLTQTLELKPFTKWTGGKRQLLPQLLEYVPKEFETYYEPFVGGGALLFEMQPQKAVINDYNQALIETYEVIRDDVEKLITLLKQHQKQNCSEYYYHIRSFDRDGRIHDTNKTWRAARILYMLRVNFNGLYRVNSNNQFNTPYGRYKNPKIVDEENLRNVSMYLKHDNVKIMNGDFQDSLRNVKEGDFIYLDPPYVPLSETANFTSYTASGFNLSSQERLRDVFKELDRRGAFVMLSNSNSSIVHDLYKEYSHTIKKVQATRMINSKATERGKIEEVLITNY